jgi:hypothetical protein
MHPPFFTVDHKIGPDIHHHGDTRPVIRRGLPERLRLTPATTGWPPVPLRATLLEDETTIQVPSGAAVTVRPKLQIVPPPGRGWREIIGRMLIRTGQRMILQTASGD